MLTGSLLAITGGLLMQFLVIDLYFFGSFLVQFGTGITEVAHSRFIEEYVPLKLLGPCISFVNIVGQLSSLIGLMSVVWLPEDADTEELKDNWTWRLVQGIQVLFFTLVVGSLLFLQKNDSPKFYLLKDKREMAEETINKIYETENQRELTLMVKD